MVSEQASQNFSVLISYPISTNPKIQLVVTTVNVRRVILLLVCLAFARDLILHTLTHAEISCACEQCL